MTRRTAPLVFVLRTLLAGLLGAAALVPCARAQTHADWSYNRAIYEVNVRQYTAAGTFAALLPHLDRLSEMGVGVLWLMPVHPIGVQNRLGSLGSPYAVRDYRAVNPEFGTMADFRAVVDRAHALGMKVMIDWVANHTAWDNALLTEHPDWYVRDGQGRPIPPPGTNWSDVIELDYTRPALRAYMIASMRYWVEEGDVDGFRFDAVSFVPTDFWTEATAALKATDPGLLLLAEGDGTQWHAAGFDATHGWGLYGFGEGVLRDVARGTRTALDLRSYALSQSAYPAGAYRLYFTQNHDENSWHGTTAELFGPAASAFAVLTATFNGLPLVYSGQEAGLDRRLAFFDRDPITWRDHPNAALYTRLLGLKRRNSALWNGTRGGPLVVVPTSNDLRVFAFLRERGADRVFVTLNLSGEARQVTLGGDAFVGAYRDAFTDASVTLGPGAVLTLPAWGYVVYEAGAVTAGEPGPNRSPAVTLGPNRPNPFRSTTTIPYALSAPADVALTVTDVLGREVRRLVAARMPAGTHEATFDGSGLPSGVYLCRLEAGGTTATRRLVLQP